MWITRRCREAQSRGSYDATTIRWARWLQEGQFTGKVDCGRVECEGLFAGLFGPQGSHGGQDTR